MKTILLTLFLSLSLFGYDDSPRCLYELQTHFFDPRYVKESFDLYRVFQSQWDSIIVNLRQDVQYVPRIVRDRARRLRPDPFEHPFDAEKVKELILAVEFEIFRDAMVRNYFYDVSATYGMFDYIRSRQEKKIDHCLGLPKKRVEKRR